MRAVVPDDLKRLGCGQNRGRLILTSVTAKKPKVRFMILWSFMLFLLVTGLSLETQSRRVISSDFFLSKSICKLTGQRLGLLLIPVKSQCFCMNYTDQLLKKCYGCSVSVTLTSPLDAVMKGNASGLPISGYR